MIIAAQPHSLSCIALCGFDEVLVRIRSALRREDLDIVSEIPFHREFQKSIGVTCRRYAVLVVWAQFEAWRAVLTEDDAGLLMPFNIAVIEHGDFTRIAANHAMIRRQSGTTVGVSLMLHDAEAKMRRVLATCESINSNADVEMYAQPPKLFR
jgi:uncharacterized protein (DUF302 family)